MFHQHDSDAAETGARALAATTEGTVQTIRPQFTGVAGRIKSPGVPSVQLNAIELRAPPRFDGRNPVWAVGDIHGAGDRLRELLREAGLIDERDDWRAGSGVGVLVGDYLNRGEDGAGVIAFVRRLQRQAHACGDELMPLLGNHDVLMCGVLAERRFIPYGELARRWLVNGGRFLDLEALERDEDAAAWLRDLPAMVLASDTLYLHSDTVEYRELGSTIAEVNGAVRDILWSGDLDRIAALFDLLCRRGELRDATHVNLLLSTFGGKRIVHGHSPVFACEPHVLHEGRCVNIEGGLWDSDESAPLGFVYWDD